MKNAILAMLGNYVSGWISREQFEDWFIPATWDAQLDPDTRKLVNRIKLRLAEFLNEDWTEPELKQELSRLVPTVRVHAVAWTSGIAGTTTIAGVMAGTSTTTITVTSKSLMASGSMVRMEPVEA
jgi:hypothetical protein